MRLMRLSLSGVDLEVRHSNTEKSAPFYKRKQCIYYKNSIGNLAALLDPCMFIRLFSCYEHASYRATLYACFMPCLR